MTQKRSGKQAPGWVFWLLIALAMPAQSALEASLDRYNIAMGDSVRLSLRSDDGSDPSDADLTALREHFEIIQSSSNISTRIINGERSQTRELTLELTPLREGSLVIPPFEVDGKRSEALSVTVGPEPTLQATDEAVIFEAEVDRSKVYVQGQLLLTLRVQQAVNLDSRSISELDIPNAYVETLGQNSFQRTINGRPWLVHEIRYAIFPESSGELVIPAQTFSGRIASGRRTLFDTRPAGRLLRRRSEELVIPVLPRPDEYPAATWLPSSDLRIEEQWSGPLDQLRIGDSITRTITVTGEGLQGAQLPPIDGNSASGLRAYPDQPLINNVNSDKGVTGIRSDSLALVAVEDGVYELPALEIPWWDTESDSLKIARLPAQRLTVLPSPGAALNTGDTPAALPGNASPAVAAPAAGQLQGSPWPWIAGFCAAGWLVTTILWWRRGQRPGSRPSETSTVEPDPPRLLDACKRNDPRLAREALRLWLREQGHRGSMEIWLREQDSASLREAVQELERHLYRHSLSDGDNAAKGAAAPSSEPWDGSALAAAIRSLPKKAKTRRKDSPLPQLYLSQ
ncbi:BatD family protein [Congregibacter litoralis]|uniref:Oxygen tolerance n=1 Tax=Congregibacter litoralis KT71 TaxID=314285 RepID=A4A7W9_9GAMM|nr:BatD family protein [Congregibacter litoralis]EAQ97764.2 Oxygen tolerance [Congregibacter litoralis KT71]